MQPYHLLRFRGMVAALVALLIGEPVDWAIWDYDQV
jgi:hypothetical protein